jgi:NADH dehydrogenase
VVVGGGFGGLNVTRALADAPVDITVVDRTNHHLFQPLLYQVAAGLLSPGLIAPALRSIIKKQENARALLAEVHELDLDRSVVCAEAPDGRRFDVPYDMLVVAAGATHSYFGKNEFAQYAPGMKTVEDARHLRHRILSAFEMAELATDPQERAEWLTFVVVGAGPTGVELVGQVAELAHRRPAAGLPVGQHQRGPHHAARGRGRRAATVRPQAAALHPPPAGEDGRRDPPELPRGGDGRRVGHD